MPHDKYKTVKKLKNSTLKKAKSLNCDNVVLESIAYYFDGLTATMNMCDGCGELVQNLRSIGYSKLCKSCYLEIDNRAWNEDEYMDNESVEINRIKILKIAKREGFSQQIIDDINAHFDSKIQEGLYTSIDGWLEQTLKVFDTHCILHTSSYFDYDEVANKYYRYVMQVSKNATDEKKQTGDIFQNLAYGFLNKNLKASATSLIVDAIVNKIEDASDKGSLRFKLVKGDYKFDYKDVDSLDYYRLADIGHDEYLGFLSFKTAEEEILFFFSENHEDAIDEIYLYISNKLEKRKKTATNASVSNEFSAADEIMKYKELFDAGAITEDEYDAKKKQLLGL